MREEIMKTGTHNRRHFLANAALSTANVLIGNRVFAAEQTNQLPPATSPAKNLRYKIAVCDWMILKRQKLGAFQLTKDIGADGVEVDMGSLGERETFDNQLAKPDVRQQFLDKARELNLEISSLAMSG